MDVEPPEEPDEETTASLKLIEAGGDVVGTVTGGAIVGAMAGPPGPGRNVRRREYQPSLRRSRTHRRRFDLFKLMNLDEAMSHAELAEVIETDVTRHGDREGHAAS